MATFKYYPDMTCCPKCGHTDLYGDEEFCSHCQLEEMNVEMEEYGYEEQIDDYGDYLYTRMKDEQSERGDDFEKI